MRVSKEELAQAVNKIKVVKTKSVDVLNTKQIANGCFLFDTNGQIDKNSTEEQAAAKVVKETKITYFYLKIDGYNNVFRPHNPQAVRDSNRIAQNTGLKKSYKWMACRETAFKSYLEYLRTKNDAFAAKTERELV